MACALALPSAGCLPIVYATPPVRVSGTLGVQRMDASPTVAPTTRAVDGWQRDLGVRATLNPLQVPKRMHDRLVDFGLGYGWQWGAARGPLHGPLVEVGIQRPLGAGERARWGVRASFMALDASRGVERIDGFQGGLQAMIEWSSFADDPYSHDCDGGTTTSAASATPMARAARACSSKPSTRACPASSRGGLSSASRSRSRPRSAPGSCCWIWTPCCADAHAPPAQIASSPGAMSLISVGSASHASRIV